MVGSKDLAFTLQETQSLFALAQNDYSFTVEQDVIENIQEITKG